MIPSALGGDAGKNVTIENDDDDDNNDNLIGPNAL